MNQIDNLILKLKGTELGRSIGEQARAGDAIAMRVVNMYSLICKRREPGSESLFLAAFEDWEKRNTVSA